MKVVLSARALDDVEAQRDWLLAMAPTAAEKAADAIAAKLALLTEYPFSAPVRGSGLREAIVIFGRDGFILQYRVVADLLTVERVLHGRQAR